MSATTGPGKRSLSCPRYLPNRVRPKSDEVTRFSSSTSRSSPSPTHSRVARSLRSKTNVTTAGTTTSSTQRRDDRRQRESGCTAEWMATGSGQRGRNDERQRAGYRSDRLLTRIAKSAVVAPCRMAVPNPRTSHRMRRAVVHRAQVRPGSRPARTRSRPRSPTSAASTRNPSAPPPQHDDDVDRLDDLLGHRRDVAGERARGQARLGQQPASGTPGRPARSAPRRAGPR